MLWADRLPRPRPQFQGFPALKFVQTPHLQSAEMLISCTQSHGVYKGTARADFSAELLLTQPAVKSNIFGFAPSRLYQLFSNRLLVCFTLCSPAAASLCSHILQLQSGFLSPATHLFPPSPQLCILHGPVPRQDIPLFPESPSI